MARTPQDVIEALNELHGVNLLALIRAAVRRHSGLFHHFRDRDTDDLCQDMLIEVLKAVPNYNGTSLFVNFVSGVVQRRMINWSRNCGRRAERDAVYASLNAGDVVEVIDPPEDPETVEGEIIDTEGHGSLVDWLGMVYRHAKRLTQTASRQGCSYEPAQRLAVAALARKLRWSVRGTRGVFEDRADLRAVIRFEQVPSRMWFCRALSLPPGSN